MAKKTSLKPKEYKEEIFRAIFDNQNDGVLLADTETKELYLGNKKICQMLGYSEEEIKTLRVNDIHPKKDLPYVLGQFEKQVKNEISISENLPIRRKDNSVFYADVNTSKIELAEKIYLLGIFREKTNQNKNEQQLIEEKIREDAVLHAIGECLIVIIDVNKEGRIVYVNKAFEEITGWKFQEVLYEPIVDILPREDSEGNPIPFKERIISKVLAGEKVVADLSSPFYYFRKDKSKFPVASTITPVIMDNKVIGAVETFRDISKENEADKAKTEFASLVSHQLRTPFATINWYIELLITEDIGSLNEKQKEYLKEVYKASKRMVGLINVLLSVSRIQMGMTRFENKLVDVISLIKLIINEEKPNIDNKKLKLEEIYDKNIPKIMADPKQLTMIFQNLLSNAIKYSFINGKITFKIGVQNKDLIISVADSGIGISDVAKPKIFNKFFRANNAKEQDPGGIGLGLYISKAVVDLMKGRIWFESHTEEESLSAGRQGTTFYVTLPLDGDKSVV